MKIILPFIAAAVVAAAPATAIAQPTVCLEDQPCFNWTQDGNGARGVVLETGQTVVVRPCRYQHLWYGLYHHHIDRKRTDVLKGDRWARRYGCGYDVLDY